MMGLIEPDWVSTLGAVDPGEMLYEDFVVAGSREAARLRERGAELVIALTHMRLPNDKRLAREATGIDIILAGHDHYYSCVHATLGVLLPWCCSPFGTQQCVVYRGNRAGGGQWYSHPQEWLRLSAVH